MAVLTFFGSFADQVIPLIVPAKDPPPIPLKESYRKKFTVNMICFVVFRKHLDNRDNGGGGRQHFGGSENFQRPTSSPAFQDEEKNPPFSGGFLPPRQRYKWISSPYITVCTETNEGIFNCQAYA